MCAKGAGCGLVTAFGYDWVPGNLAGALALRDAGPDATRVEIGYFGATAVLCTLLWMLYERGPATTRSAQSAPAISASRR